VAVSAAVELNENMRKRQGMRATKKVKRPKNPKVSCRKNPLTEDEALNLICDARSDESTYPLEKLLKKFKHGLAD
jgi:hypothetical protein